MYAQRCRELEEIGEIFLPIMHTTSVDSGSPTEYVYWFPRSQDFVKAARELWARCLSIPEIPVVSKTVNMYIALPSLGNLYYTERQPLSHISNFALDPAFVEEWLLSDKVNQKLMQDHLVGSASLELRTLILHLKVCSMMRQIYHLLPGAEISTCVLETKLGVAKWVKNIQYEGNHTLTASQAFDCIAMFDSGVCKLNPDSLSQVFAISSGNSLYILASLLCDPYEQAGTAEIRRVVGNVGRPGMTFLISPSHVETREADPEHSMAINHTRFDGKPGNYFANTSIHLSFTSYELPLIPDDNHQLLIDRIFVLVETLVSVYDGKSWVGEVDILKTFAKGIVTRIAREPHCCSPVNRSLSYQAAVKECPNLMGTSIENWDELIEAPTSGIVVVKAHKNRLARLAVTAMAQKLGFLPVILPEEACWSCCIGGLLAERADRVALIW